MVRFLIKKIEKKKKIIELKYDKNGYDFKPKINAYGFEINKITIFNSFMIDSILSKKIEKQFKRVAAITYDVLSTDDEDSTADAVIALDEISKLKNTILHKYKEYLDKTKEKKILKQLKILEEQLKTKMVYSREKTAVVTEEKGRGR